MKHFADFVIRFRWPVLVVIVALTAFFAVAALDLEIKTDFLASLNEGDSLVQLYDYIGDNFGGNDVAMIALKTDEVFSPDVIAGLQGFTEEAEGLAEIESVLSLASIMDIRQTGDGVEVRDLIPAGESLSSEELTALREYTLSKPMYTGIFVSPDARVVTLLCRLKPDVERVELSGRLRELAFSTFGEEAELYFAGLPFQIFYMDEMILDDLVLLIPLVAALVLLILALFYRHLAGVFLPLGGVLISLVWILGLMALTKTPISMLTGAMPVVLIAVGTAYAIHVVSRYYEERRNGFGRRELSRRALAGVGTPVLMAGLTTVIGFSSLAVTRIRIIYEFGLFAALGTLAATLIALTLVPALLAIIGDDLKEKPHKNKATKPKREPRLAHGTALLVTNHPRLIVVVMALVVVGGLISLPWLNREVNLIGYFEEDSTLRRGEQMVEEYFGGSVPMQVYAQGEIRQPSVLRRLELIERFMRAEVGRSTQSIGGLLRELNYNLYGVRRIPQSLAEVNDLYYFIAGNDIANQMLGKNSWWSGTPASENDYDLETETVLLTNLGSADTPRMIASSRRIDELIEEHIATEEAAVTVAEMDSVALAKLREYQIERLALSFALDADYRQIPLEQDEIAAVLEQLGVDGSPPLDGAFLPYYLEPELRDYVWSPACDVELNTDIEREWLLAALVNLWADTTNPPGEEKIAEAARGGLSAALLLWDPEGPEYLATSVYKLSQRTGSRYQIDRGQDILLTELGIDPAENGEFVEDLRGLLYELTDRVAYVPVELARQLTGSEPGEVYSLRVEQTGFPRIFGNLDRALIDDQLISIAVALGLVLLLLIINFRSLVGGLLTAIPILFTLIINFAFMVLVGIDLDFVTIMIAGLIIGIGVDYTIHFSVALRKGLRSGEDFLPALTRTISTTGKAIIINATSVALGFLVLSFSQIIPLRTLGMQVAITMGV
ncbi:MMPL family transporter, partial [bacterium]|nr:MMPL family transporter [bacterium]